MKKIKNKFIVFIIFILSAVVGFLLFSPANKNLDSSVTLRTGEAILIKNQDTINLSENNPALLDGGDTIKTLTDDSLAIIKWGDGSITRLGGIGELKVEESLISHDKTQINIKFNLLAGKTWSNVVNFIPNDSHFIQTFNDHEAAVRGTIFDINLDNGYIYVGDHAINIVTPTGEEVLIEENKPYSLEDGKLISLLDFIKNFKDTSWTKINNNLDKIKLEDLQAEMIKTLQAGIEFIDYESITKNNDIAEYIRGLSGEEKQKKYNAVLGEYQNFHFANSQTPDLLDEKLKLKEILLLLADKQDQELLIKSSLYDLEEVFKTNNPLSFERIIKMFETQNELVDKLNISLPEVLKFDALSDEFSIVLQSRIETLKNSFGNVDFTTLPTITPEMLKNLHNSADEKVQEFLNNNLNSDFIKSLGTGAFETFNSLFNK